VICLRKTVEIKLAIEIDDEVISRDDLLKEFDRILKHADGVGSWGEIIDKKIFIVAKDEYCGRCNWHSTVLYRIASSQEEAEKLYKETGRAFCGECIVENMVINSLKINS